MKTKKWLWIILISILTLVVLAGVGAAGYRLGLTQNPAAIKQLAELRAQRLNAQGNAPQQNGKAINPQAQGPGQMWDGQNPHMQGFDPRNNSPRGFDQQRFGSGCGFDGGGHRGESFGFLHLIVLGALLWFGYKYVKNSGWKLVREVQPVPATVNVEEKKDEA